MINKIVAIAILARDCEKKLRKNINEIEKLQENFQDCDIVVVENDSVDNTKQVLNEWKQRNKSVELITLDNVFINNERNGSSKNRIERMVYYRNQYLKYFYNTNRKYDYLIVIDIDVDRFNSKSLLKSIENAPSDWCGLFANGRFYTKILGLTLLGKYYDNYAFVPANNTETSLDFKEVKLNNDLVNKGTILHKYFKCLSAFGGIAIYKFPCLKGLLYRAEPNNRSTYYKSICEHVLFNDNLSKQGSLYISRNMIVLYEKQKILKCISSLFIIEHLVVFIHEVVLHKKYIR